MVQVVRHSITPRSGNTKAHTRRRAAHIPFVPKPKNLAPRSLSLSTYIIFPRPTPSAHLLGSISSRNRANRDEHTHHTMFVARNHVHSKAPAIEDALQVAIANVRSDSAREDWVLCGFQGGDDIRLIGTGVGGVEVSTQHDLPHPVGLARNISRACMQKASLLRKPICFLKAINLVFEMSGALGSVSLGQPHPWVGLCSKPSQPPNEGSRRAGAGSARSRP